MSVVAAAIIGSMIVGAYVSKESAEAQAEGIEKGTKAQGKIASENLEFQREMAEMQRQDFAPWRDMGVQALDKIWTGIESGEFEVGKLDLTQDPGYQFRMAEGIKAIDRSASARGKLIGTSHDKNIIRFAEGTAANEYANAYARELEERNRRFNMLSGLSQGGQASAAGQAQASGRLATTGGNIMSNVGQAQNIAAANIGAVRGSAYDDYGQVINQAAQNWLTYDMNKPAATTA